jgi:hypothetical protein
MVKREICLGLFNCAMTPTKASQVIEIPDLLHLPGQSDLSQVFEVDDIFI